LSKHKVQPLVSVILPTYNRETYLGESIRSVLAQTYRSFELIVVDDGSTDGTEGLVRSFSPPVRYARQPHAGVARARNRGLDEARGELIAFQDSDDLWHQDKLALQVALLNERPEVGVVCTAEQIIDPDGNVIGGQWKTLHSGWVTEALFQSIFVIMPSAVVRRHVVDRVGRFDGSLRINSDYQFWLRASLVTEFFALDQPLVYERRWADRLTSAKAETALLQYQMLVHFHEELGGKASIRPEIASRALSKAAFRAGRALRRERRFAEARQMFGKSLGHRFTVRAGWAYLRTCRAPRSGGSGTGASPRWKQKGSSAA
jgi:glycosyltransferase involved in cell wall biosynthesis